MEELNNWDQLFDKRAKKVPAEFPGNANNLTLELEDVNEEITDDVEDKSSSIPQKPVLKEEARNPPLTTKVAQDRRSNYNKFVREQSKTQIEKKSFKSPTKLQHSKKPVQDDKEEQKRERCSCHKKSNARTQEPPKEQASRDKPDAQPKEIENAAAGADLQEELSSPFDRKEREVEEVGSQVQDRTNEKEPPSTIVIEQRVDNTDPVDSGGWIGVQFTLETAKELRLVLFGSTSLQFGLEWHRQSIRLNKPSHYALRYHKGPTERVMASIQAHVLKHVLFDDVEKTSNATAVEVARYHKKSLILGLVDILWQAGSKEKVSVCLPKKDKQLKIGMKYDDIIEKLEIFEFTEKEELQKFIHCHSKLFEDEEKLGCILFVFSVILSRTTKRVKEDIADPCECLMGQLDNGTQALVNLLLVGRATRHVFNNTKEIAEPNGNTLTIHGIKQRSEVGFLSYEEVEDPKHYTIGSMLKTPVYPVWVIFHDNHSSVLFCKKRNLLSDWKLERRFDLYYFAGILRHFSLLDEDIRLTIDTMQPFNPDDYDYEFQSSLEETIRTKWQESLIEWNGYHRF